MDPMLNRTEWTWSFLDYIHLLERRPYNLKERKAGLNLKEKGMDPVLN